MRWLLVGQPRWCAWSSFTFYERRSEVLIGVDCAERTELKIKSTKTSTLADLAWGTRKT